MASKNTKARAQSYSMLTDIEKNILKRHYDGGMVGTGRKYQAMITRAVEETDLARERVENGLEMKGTSGDRVVLRNNKAKRSSYRPCREAQTHTTFSVPKSSELSSVKN
ncbi:hypothetical protein OS493_035428 [Desmophyllum pertusum]|uniref:Uncharacterized protein n=1 Tax=Desmophyllum pertusum TaxID=174260 RepID=A0A9W9ZIH8_9CNID|nr:hypothetical protein OS493_035428 [Desmophyllum pertusum]